jgi:hypothetical protein
MSGFGKWCPSLTDTVDPTPIKVRSLLIECFLEAQKSTMERAGTTLGSHTDIDTLRASVEKVIRAGFKEVNGNYDNPTKADLEKILVVLSRKAAAWGTPPEIIDHHKKEMSKVIEMLP